MTTNALNSWRGKWLLPIAMALAALALVGLGGGNAAANGGAQASKAKKTVSIKGFAYHPGTLTVSAGTKVAFVNSDSAPHTATRSGAFDTGTIGSGSSKTVTLKRKGTFVYHCTIHPDMHGKIIVK